MEIGALQFVLVVLITGLLSVDMFATQLFTFQYALACWIIGAVLGAPGTGLIVGGTIQLMSMGALSLGGSSSPNYLIAGIVATVIACITGSTDASIGITIGVLVAMLFVQLDVMFKIYNSFVYKVIRNLAAKREYKRMRMACFLPHLWEFLQGAVPVAIVLAFGQPAIEAINAFMPEWFTTGLSVAAGILPVTGFAMLLTFMPVNKFFAFIIAGYVLASYLGLEVLPIALLGAVVAVEYFRNKSEAPKALVTTEGNGGELEDE